MSETKELAAVLEAGAAALNRARVDSQAWRDLIAMAAKGVAVIAVDTINKTAAEIIVSWAQAEIAKRTGGEP